VRLSPSLLHHLEKHSGLTELLLRPSSSLPAGFQSSQTAKGALDSVAGKGQPESDKSTTQKATDSVTGGGGGGADKSYVDQAKVRRFRRLRFLFLLN
jgi:hypothetical protein